jgi:UDP-glucose 4-epimerase
LVYGAGVPGNFLALMKAITQGIPLPLGSVNNRRTLLSVYNLSDLLCVLVDHPAAGNNRFLAGDSEEISTPDLIRRLAKALHRPARIFRCPEALLLHAGELFQQQAAVRRLCSSLVLDTSKTVQILGWSAPMDIDSGLNRTAEWFLKPRMNRLAPIPCAP